MSVQRFILSYPFPCGSINHGIPRELQGHAILNVITALTVRIVSGILFTIHRVFRARKPVSDGGPKGNHAVQRKAVNTELVAEPRILQPSDAVRQTP